MNSWDETIHKWLEYFPSYKTKEKEIFEIFKLAINNAPFPKQSWFGIPPSKRSISVLFGRIYLIGLFDKAIELLVDENLEEQLQVECRIVGTSKADNIDLFWLKIPLDKIEILTENKFIWEHYRRAAFRANDSRNIYAERKDWLTGKTKISDLKAISTKPIEESELTKKYERELESSQQSLRNNRLNRLKKANAKAIEVTTVSKSFLRNADVVVETLERAKGICEYCKQDAPFIKDTDGKPFLEVHHIKPLAEDGEDTIMNTVALCPNCHRQAHYGKKTLIIKNQIRKPTI